MLPNAILLSTAALLAGLAQAQRTQSVWGQCGGSSYSGPTQCAQGNYCSKGNDYYYQCVPATQVADDPYDPEETGFPLDDPYDPDEEEGEGEDGEYGDEDGGEDWPYTPIPTRTTIRGGGGGGGFPTVTRTIFNPYPQPTPTQRGGGGGGGFGNGKGKGGGGGGRGGGRGGGGGGRGGGGGGRGGGSAGNEVAATSVVVIGGRTYTLLPPAATGAYEDEGEDDEGGEEPVVEGGEGDGEEDGEDEGGEDEGNDEDSVVARKGAPVRRAKFMARDRRA